MTEQFGPFRLAYMDEFLNNREGGKTGREVMRRLLVALEASMVAGIDVIRTSNPEIPDLVGKLQAALADELKQESRDLTESVQEP